MRTIQGYQSSWKNNLQDLFGKKKISDITFEDLQNFHKKYSRKAPYKYDQSIKYSNKEHLYETPKQEYCWKLVKNISVLGHELTHALFSDLAKEIPHNISISQKLYQELCDEAMAYINTGYINYEFITSHMNDFPEYERFKNVKAPTSEKDKGYFVRFIQDALEKEEFHSSSPSTYVDKVISEQGKRGIHSSSPGSNEEYLKSLEERIVPFFGERLKLPKIQDCHWYSASKNGGFYIVGRNRIMLFNHEGHPLYASFFNGKEFHTRLYSRTYEEKDGKLTPKDYGDISYSRPFLEEENNQLEKIFENGTVHFRKVQIPSMATFHDFIEWQNQEQQKALTAIQKKRQNPRG